MLTLRKLRELTLTGASANGRPPYLSAASGLVCIKSFMYVVADDELHMAVFNRDDNNAGYLVRLFDGALPADKNDRKRQKPDFESLTLIPPFGDSQYGAILASGSGSRDNRRRGALISLDDKGAIRGVPRSVDLSSILAPLEKMFPALNIEGAIVCGDEMRLFQRGNKKHSKSAIIRFPLPQFLDAILGRRHETISPIALHEIELGHVNGVPLGFTDAAALPNGEMAFAAVAEDTDDSYSDGLCVGAAVGVVGADWTLRWIRDIDPAYKIEGLSARMEDAAIHFLLVTDADDIAVPASLYSGQVSVI